MLKRYSFFGMTLELLLICGVFLGLLLLIVLYAWLEARRRTKERPQEETER